MIGRALAHYRVTGAGGMGEVYRATDEKLGREVAIKILPSEVAQDAERLGRFQREAQVLASLNHPNLGAIYGLDETDGKPFLVLELVEGEELKERLKRGAVPVDEAKVPSPPASGGKPSADGSSFLFLLPLEGESTSDEIHVSVNGFEELGNPDDDE